MLFRSNEDEDMALAYVLAQRTFRYFWREMSWEYRRIVPVLDLSCVKIAFHVPGEPSESRPSFEHLWIGEVAFDGETPLDVAKRMGWV